MALAGIVLAVVLGKYLITYAQQVIDSFTDTSKVADTWNVTVPTSTGEVKLAAKSCDNSQWFCSEDTVCSNVLGDGDYILVARADASFTKQWQISNTDCDQPQCGQDGGNNGDNLVADNTVNFASYPARDYCKSLGGRLPTKTELLCIYDNQANFGNNFATSSYYWSATESMMTSNAYGVYFADGSVNSGYKTYSYRVRCVQGW